MSYNHLTYNIAFGKALVIYDLSGRLINYAIEFNPPPFSRQTTLLMDWRPILICPSFGTRSMPFIWSDRSYSYFEGFRWLSLRPFLNVFAVNGSVVGWEIHSPLSVFKESDQVKDSLVWRVDGFGGVSRIFPFCGIYYGRMNSAEWKKMGGSGFLRAPSQTEVGGYMRARKIRKGK